MLGKKMQISASSRESCPKKRERRRNNPAWSPLALCMPGKLLGESCAADEKKKGEKKRKSGRSVWGWGVEGEGRGELVGGGGVCGGEWGLRGGRGTKTSPPRQQRTCRESGLAEISFMFRLRKLARFGWKGHESVYYSYSFVVIVVCLFICLFVVLFVCFVLLVVVVVVVLVVVLVVCVWGRGEGVSLLLFFCFLFLLCLVFVFLLFLSVVCLFVFVACCCLTTIKQSSYRSNQTSSRTWLVGAAWWSDDFTNCKAGIESCCQFRI